ncbi:MAG: Rieske (2Fe-2S) protein [Desulfuromonadales bacterium]|nr:Rieske (2Fe-2S) protein [Desulfuromonadales bacterium]
MIMLGGVGGLLAVAAGWPIFRFLMPDKGDDSAGQVKIGRELVQPGSSHFFQYLGRPAVVLQPSPGKFVALSAVCTHLGCVVQWQEDQGQFLCPCHGGRFSEDGAVVSGPPPEPLETLPVVLEGDQILVG